jgi:hypothetical protein
MTDLKEIVERAWIQSISQGIISTDGRYVNRLDFDQAVTRACEQYGEAIIAQLKTAEQNALKLSQLVDRQRRAIIAGEENFTRRLDKAEADKKRLVELAKGNITGCGTCATIVKGAETDWLEATAAQLPFVAIIEAMK